MLKNLIKASAILSILLFSTFAKAADPIRDAWIADMEKQGLPGQELYDLVQSTLAKAKAGN